MSLLEVHHLKKYFPIRGGIFRRKTGDVHAVDDISLTIQEGETLGLVGESGCGKTTVGRALLRLIEPDSGAIHFMGQDLMALSQSRLRGVRRNMQIIFQDPFESLDARQTIGDILEEPYEIHKVGSVADRKINVKNLLNRVGMPEEAVSRLPDEVEPIQAALGSVRRHGLDGQVAALEARLRSLTSAPAPRE